MRVVALQGVEHDDLALRLGLVAEVEPPEPDDGIVGPPRLVVAPLEMRDVPLGVLREVDKVHGPGGNCIKIGLPGKLILRDYFQENRRPFLLLRISFPGRAIFIQFIPAAMAADLLTHFSMWPLRTSRRLNLRPQRVHG